MTNTKSKRASRRNMIIHFIRDEKVTDSIVSNYDHINGDNLFLIFSEADSLRYTSPSTLSRNNVIVFDYKRNDINGFLKKNPANAIVLHSLNYSFAKVVNKIKHDLPIVWVAWGVDIYGLPRIAPTIYAPLTNKYLLARNRTLLAVRFLKKSRLLGGLYYNLIKRKRNPYSQIKRAFKKISYFSTYLEEDYHYFSKYYPNKMQFQYCSFTSIDQYLAGNASSSIQRSSNNILIGNSNTPECNHLDVIDFLGNFRSEIQDSKVYAPLSYGKDDIYKAEIKMTGVEVLGSIFSPLDDFMEREAYVSMLTSCSTGIFFHYRQQALGNIISMLYLGARVYLSSKSPTYHYLSRIGVIVFDLRKQFEIFKNSKLDDQSILKNRQILSELFAEERVYNDLDNLQNLICQ